MLSKVSLVSTALSLPYYFWTAVLVAVCVAWGFYTYHLDLVFAWSGFSPVTIMYQWADAASPVFGAVGWSAPPKFEAGYPSGVELLGSSSFMHVYRLAYAWFAIEPDVLVPFIVFFELLILCIAVTILARVIIPTITPAALLILIILIIASSARDMSLSRYAAPFFVGQFYNVVDALRFFAIAALLGGRPLLAGFLLALAFTMHPSLGVITAVFMGAVLLSRPWDVIVRNIVSRGYILGLVTFAGIAGFWTYFQIGLSPLIGSSIESSQWADYTRLFSYHWYPLDLGIFSGRNAQYIVPFSAVALLAGYFVWKERPISDVTWQVLFGALSLLILIVIGLTASHFSWSPTLIKLSLARASDTFVFFAVIYIVSGLLKILQTGNAWQRLLSVAILISPFIYKPGFPAVLILMLITPDIMKAMRSTHRSLEDWLLSAAYLGCASLVFVYVLFGDRWPIPEDHWITDVSSYLGILPLAVSLLFVIALSFGASRIKANTAVPVIFLVAALSVSWLWHNRALTDPELLGRASDYKDVQLWARENSPQDAVFFVDPSHSYGWRGYSQRNSAGSLREWLGTAWIYNSDPQIFGEGLRRAALLAIKPEDFMGKYSPSVWGFLMMEVESRRRYYNQSVDFYRKLADETGADYFVFNTIYVNGAIPLEIAYKNKEFAIGILPQQ